MYYYARSPQTKRRRNKKALFIPLILLVCAFIGVALLRLVFPSKQQQAVNHLQFDQSATDVEKKQITDAIAKSNKTLSHDVKVSIKTVKKAETTDMVLSVFVPVTGLYSPMQNVQSDSDASKNAFIESTIDSQVANYVGAAISGGASAQTRALDTIDTSYDKVVFVPADKLTAKVKLLSFDGDYYLDSFKTGGYMRVAELSGDGVTDIVGVSFNNLPKKDSIFKANMTGVTALTRLMMQKLNSVQDPLYFSKLIGPFLKDADLTHVSNEVSFKENCQFNHAVFCSDPRFIKTLQDSGVDLIELTGNHNNDSGDQFNTDTINTYKGLSIATFGGGLNADEAKKPYFADVKGSKVTFLGYNYPDSPNGFAIADSTGPGANSFDYEKIKTDIASAKKQSQFVIVDVQYAECYAYPDGYVEFPLCNSPISGQQEAFRKIIDLGADMVIGSQAHQPQIYELYNGKPIYYGLGNLYFDQIQWPGTERGIVLTHYFLNGKLLQTKLTPTVYDEDLQARKMTNAQATKFLDFLNSSR